MQFRPYDKISTCQSRVENIIIHDCTMYHLCPGRNIILLTRCALVEADYSQYKLGPTLNYMYMPEKKARMRRQAENSQANSFSGLEIARYWELIKHEAWLMS